jgi:hypothetical protein
LSQEVVKHLSKNRQKIVHAGKPELTVHQAGTTVKKNLTPGSVGYRHFPFLNATYPPSLITQETTKTPPIAGAIYPVRVMSTEGESAASDGNLRLISLVFQ